MANSALGKFAEKVLTDVKQSASKGQSDYGVSRRDLNKQKGQILIINKKRFMTTLGSLVPQIQNNQKIRDRIWEEFSTKAAERSKRIPAARFKELTEAALELKKSGRLQKTDFIFFVNSYRIASYLKSETLKNTIKKVFKEFNKTFTEEETQNLSLLAGKDNKFGAQLGHSEMTKTGHVGVASSALRVAAQKAEIDKAIENKSFSADQSKKLLSIITQYEADLGLTLDHVMIVDNKKIRKDYIPILSWQDTNINQQLAQIEAAAIRSFENNLKDIADKEGSPSLKQAIESVILYELSSAVKKAPKKVTGNPKKSVKSKGKTAKSKKIKGKKSIQALRDDSVPKNAVKGFTGGKVTGGKVAGSFINLNTLLGPLNERINEVVKRNMVSPRLQNRTGRFASSVQVTDITRTPQGFPSIGYTYQRAPYDKFESDPNKDPRKLIDQSMREIAAQYAIGRFYTRRV